MLTVDVVAVVLLVALAPGWRPVGPFDSSSALRVTLFASAMVLGTGLLIWSIEDWRAAYVFHSVAQTNVGANGVGDFVLLRPSEWAGRPLPLENHIDIGGQLRRGKWVLLLYRNSCDDCSRLIGQYFEKGNRVFGVSDEYGVAVVQVDANADASADKFEDRRAQGKKLLFGKLDDTKHWVVETPVVVILRDGNVVHVRERSDSSSRAISGTSLSFGR